MYTNVRFKNWNLSAIFDIKVGADLYTSTMRGTYSSGRSKKTLKGRDGWYQSEEGRLPPDSKRQHGILREVIWWMA